MVLGLLFLAGGVASLIYGYNLNNNLEAQWDAMFSSASVDPGTPWIIGGAIATVLGLVFIIFALFNANRNNSGQVQANYGERSRLNAESYCPYCGAKLLENALYCIKCGRKVK